MHCRRAVRHARLHPDPPAHNRFAICGEHATPSAALAGPAGKALHSITLTGSASGDGHQIDLPLNHLARGEYLIAIDGSGERTLVPIRIN